MRNLPKMAYKFELMHYYPLPSPSRLIILLSLSKKTIALVDSLQTAIPRDSSFLMVSLTSRKTANAPENRLKLAPYKERNHLNQPSIFRGANLLLVSGTGKPHEKKKSEVNSLVASFTPWCLKKNMAHPQPFGKCKRPKKKTKVPTPWSWGTEQLRNGNHVKKNILESFEATMFEQLWAPKNSCPKKKHNFLNISGRKRKGLWWKSPKKKIIHQHPVGCDVSLVVHLKTWPFCRLLSVGKSLPNHFF